MQFIMRRDFELNLAWMKAFDFFIVSEIDYVIDFLLTWDYLPILISKVLVICAEETWQLEE